MHGLARPCQEFYKKTDKKEPKTKNRRQLRLDQRIFSTAVRATNQAIT